MQPTSKEWVLCSTFWTRPCLLFGILLHGRSFYSLLFFFNNLFISVQTPDIHFILLIIIHYSFILLLKLFQLWALEDFSAGSYIHLTCLLFCLLSSYSLPLQDILGSSYIFPALTLESGISSRSPRFFFGE